MFHCIHRNVAAPSWFDSKMAVSNSAVHEFDIARWMLDAELTGITCSGRRRRRPSSPARRCSRARMAHRAAGHDRGLQRRRLWLRRARRAGLREGNRRAARGRAHRDECEFAQATAYPPIGVRVSPMPIGCRPRPGSRRSRRGEQARRQRLGWLCGGAVAEAGLRWPRALRTNPWPTAALYR
jgi:hypothetical protein